jgi:hypothetical protein
MRYALDPAMPVLLRPDGAVQIGWDPHRAVLVRPPRGLSPGGLAALLREMAAPMSAAELRRLARGRGLREPAELDGVLAELVSAGVVQPAGLVRACARALSIRVHGGGPLSDLLADGLRCSGARVSRSSHAAGVVAGVDLVVLADALAADPRLVRELHAAGVPHLPVRMRDGAGLVGPLVIPGVSSCLCCVDLHRTDRDPAWPALAAQLRDVVGVADRAAVLATAGLAMGQLQQIIAGVHAAAPGVSHAPPPATLNTTLEVDIAVQSIRARRWPRHPLCGCWPGLAGRAAPAGRAGPGAAPVAAPGAALVAAPGAAPVGPPAGPHPGGSDLRPPSRDNLPEGDGE